MLALRYERFGEPVDVVDIADIALPEPETGEVRVRMLRSPVHNHDLATIRGVYGYKPALPAVGGTEFVGEVDGRRVVATVPNGAWAEYVIVHASAALPVPDAIPDEIAAQLLAMPLSAVVLFDELRTEPGMWIGQNAAGGAVGRIVMQLAQESDVNIVNLVRSEKSAQSLRDRGARHVVVTDDAGNWQREIRELTDGKGLARIVDSVAGPQTLALQQVLADFGEIIIFGGLSRAPIKLDPSLMIALECTVRGFWMSTWINRASSVQRSAAMQRVFDMAMRGTLPLSVEDVYSLGDWKTALAAAETPGRGGKVLFSA